MRNCGSMIHKARQVNLILIHLNLIQIPLKTVLNIRGTVLTSKPIACRLLSNARQLRCRAAQWLLEIRLIVLIRCHGLPSAWSVWEWYLESFNICSDINVWILLVIVSANQIQIRGRVHAFWRTTVIHETPWPTVTASGRTDSKCDSVSNLLCLSLKLMIQLRMWWPIASLRGSFPHEWDLVEALEKEFHALADIIRHDDHVTPSIRRNWH
jgi:hypothetical protein